MAVTAAAPVLRRDLCRHAGPGAGRQRRDLRGGERHDAPADAVRHARSGRAAVRPAARDHVGPAAEPAAADGSAAPARAGPHAGASRGVLPVRARRDARGRARRGPGRRRDARPVDDDGRADRARPVVHRARGGARTLRRGDHRQLLARHARRAAGPRHVADPGRSASHDRRRAGAGVCRAVPRRAGLHPAGPERRAEAPGAAAHRGRSRRARAGRLDRAGARRTDDDLQPVGAGVPAHARVLDHRRPGRARMAVRVDARPAADAAGGHGRRAADRLREHRQPHLGTCGRPLGRAVVAACARRLETRSAAPPLRRVADRLRRRPGSGPAAGACRGAGAAGDQSRPSRKRWAT